MRIPKDLFICYSRKAYIIPPMDKKEGLTFISDCLDGQMQRQDICTALIEQDVPTSTAYRWFSEAYKNHHWEEDAPGRPKGTSIRDEVLKSLLDCLNSARAENDSERISVYAMKLCQAAKAMGASHV